jgi:hypothetical protein
MGPEPEVFLEFTQGELKAQIAQGHNTPDALVTPRGRLPEL